VKKIEPISPDNIQTKEEYLRSRIIQIEQMIESLWPENHDFVPAASKHFGEELDRTILLLKKRKNKFLKNYPKKNKGGQVKWNQEEYKILLIIEKDLREENRLTRKDCIEELSKIYSIGFKKIEERLKKAHESEKIDSRGLTISK